MTDVLDGVGVDGVDAFGALGLTDITENAPAVPNSPPGESARRHAPRWKAKGSRTRRGYTIHAYIGANGHGKTLAMMHDTYLSIMTGRPILSTVRVLDPRTGDTYDGYTPLTRMSQLVEANRCDVLLDEIVGALPSMPGQQLPLEVQLLLNQMRRRDICLRWTAPSWMRCNVVLREVTQAVTVCRGYWPEYDNRGDDTRLWGMNRLFRWTTYDAYEFTDWSDNKELKLKGRANAWVRRKGAAAAAAASYDTFDAVDNIDSGEGFCFRCGGQRPKLVRPACTCPA